MQTEVLKKKANKVHKNTGSEAQSHTPYIRSLSAPISALIPLQDSRSESCAADVRGSQGEQKLFESFILIIQFSQTKPKTHLQPVPGFHYISEKSELIQTYTHPERPVSFPLCWLWRIHLPLPFSTKLSQQYCVHNDRRHCTFCVFGNPLGLVGSID